MIPFVLSLFSVIFISLGFYHDSVLTTIIGFVFLFVTFIITKLLTKSRGSELRTFSGAYQHLLVEDIKEFFPRKKKKKRKKYYKETFFKKVEGNHINYYPKDFPDEEYNIVEKRKNHYRLNTKEEKSVEDKKLELIKMAEKIEEKEKFSPDYIKDLAQRKADSYRRQSSMIRKK